MRRLVSIAIRCGAVLLAAAATVAQAPSRADFDVLATGADNAVAEHRLGEAAQLYESIRKSARDADDDFWEARGRYGLGRVERARGEYGSARENLAAALQTFERLNAAAFIGAAAAELGDLEYSLGNDRESRNRFERAIQAFDAVGDRRARARALLGRLTATPPNDLTSREREYDDLLVEARASRDSDFEADILHSWGDALFSAGEFERASEKLEAAARIASNVDDRDLLARTYTSLGRLYRVHGQPLAAVKYQLKALELSQTSASPRLRVQSLNAVGVAYEASGDLGKAREYYERALAATDGTESPAILEFLRAQLGGLLVAAGDAEPARVMLEGVLARGIDQYPSTRYGQLSAAYKMLGRFDDARAAAARALDTCPTGTPLDCVYGHLRMVDAQLALGHDAAALAEEEVALKSIEDLHGKLVATDFLKQEFHHFWESAYSVGISLHFRRREFREALETAELARARGFVDLLASHDIAVDRSPSRTLPALTTRGAEATAIRSQTAVDAPNADALAATAARLKSTIVEYWVASDAVYIWTVGPTGAVRGASVKIASAKLDQLVRSTLPFAQQVEPRVESATARSRGDAPIQIAARANRVWRELYDLLLSPIEHDLPHVAGARLTIVAHGPLLHVPFAALRDPQGRYLIERYTIHSVPAAAVLQFTSGRRQVRARTGGLLLVADPAAPPVVSGEAPLPRLPGALQEAQAIARLVPASRTTMLAGGDATEAHVRSSLASRAVLHFATHAIVRDADPMASFLALDRSRDRDGRLTARKIYGLQLDADLVVLSACRSGDGMVTGDGIAGLARAFFSAGAASVLVSVWDVADAPTSRLLPAFYRRWLGGADKARALRAAQLELIRDLRAGQVRTDTPVGEIAIPEDPAFWAGFVLLGEPD